MDALTPNYRVFSVKSIADKSIALLKVVELSV
jgi:hypothetical protein